MKVLLMVFSFLLVSACSSKSGFEPYEASPGYEKTGVMSYQFEEGDFTLSGSEIEGYPGQDDLKSDFFRYIKEEINDRGISGGDYIVEVSVEWGRRMSGDDVFSSAVCQFNSKIMKNDQIVATDYGDPLNAESIKYENRNIFNNLKRIADTLTQSGDAESEQRELKRCAKLIVERLPK